MKDAVHHLKHVQKKVVQSVKKAENNKSAVNGKEAAHILSLPNQVELTRQKKG